MRVICFIYKSATNVINTNNMLKHISTTIAAALLMCGAFLASCSKADNSAKIIFWQTKTTAEKHVAHGVTSIKINVAGNYAGSMAAEIYFDFSPDCTNTQTVIYSHNLGEAETGVVSYEVFDQDNFKIGSGTLDLKSGVCKVVELAK